MMAAAGWHTTLIRELLDRMTDTTKLRPLFAENAVWEFVCGASAGLPTSVARGSEEITTGIQGFLTKVEELQFGDPTIYQYKLLAYIILRHDRRPWRFAEGLCCTERLAHRLTGDLAGGIDAQNQSTSRYE
jgi:hypothetical protein